MNKINLSNQEVTDFLKANIEAIIKYNIDPEQVENQMTMNDDCAKSNNLANNDVCDVILKSGRIFLARVLIKDKVKKQRLKKTIKQRLP